MRFSLPAYSGFGDRLLSEVKKLAPKDVKIRVGVCQGVGELGCQGSGAPHGAASPPALPKISRHHQVAPSFYCAPEAC